MCGTVLKVSIGIVLLAIILNALLRRIWINHGIISEPQKEYDYIIVGAGSAGCVLARRLWERSNLSILVIEAGTTAPWISAVPLLAPALQGYEADWAFKTVPQEHSQRGLKNRQSAWPRGKVLGGSSVLNYMLHTWGSRSDFDHLWSSVGPEWSFDSVLPYFRKSESFLMKAGDSTSGLRGEHGPMPVTEFDSASSTLSRAFLRGLQSLGFKTGDLNGKLEIGAMPAQSNIQKGWRMSTFDAYLNPIMENANIHLLTSTLAVKVLVENTRAVGVLAMNLYSGQSFRIWASKEIIVSAGVIGSPHLLMLSGIGLKDELENNGIPVIHELPGVGRNLMDHLNIALYFHLDAPVSTTTAKIRSVRDIWKYITKGTGYLSNSGVESVVRIPVPGHNSSHNKVFLMLFNLGSINQALFTSVSNMINGTFLETFPDTKNDSKEGFIILSSCTHPLSRGKVSLATSNPTDPPLIDPNYLSQTEDVKCLIKAMKTAARVGSTKPLRELGARLHLPGYRECSQFKQSLEDDRYLECWLRTSAITSYHPVGTCSMGSNDDPMAVLDWKFRVRGMRNLRVVDSSAFPHHISGNPNAAVMMIAEKASDFIIKDLKKMHSMKES